MAPMEMRFAEWLVRTIMAKEKSTAKGIVIAAMAVTHAASAFFFDVTHFTAGCHLAVASNDAAAGECGEAEKSNETHAVLNPLKQVQQTLYR